MNDEERPAGFDPYRPLAQSLKSGDAINKRILWRPRQRIVFSKAGASSMYAAAQAT